MRQTVDILVEVYEGPEVIHFVDFPLDLIVDLVFFADFFPRIAFQCLDRE